jgi:hypothetical protein
LHAPDCLEEYADGAIELFTAARAQERAAVAEEIAAAIEAQDDRGYDMYRSAYSDSAAVARAHGRTDREEQR